MSIQPDEPAFPLPAVYSPECGTLPGQGGMSLRDWYAGMALISRPEITVEEAWIRADAMIRERKRWLVGPQ